MDRYTQVKRMHQVSSITQASLRTSQLLAAGEIEVRNGVLKFISDRSGHYEPEAEFLEQAMKVLKEQGIDLSNVERGSW